MGIMAIPIPILQVISHSFPLPFPILSPIPITVGIPWDSHSHWESHSHGHLYFIRKLPKSQNARISSFVRFPALRALRPMETRYNSTDCSATRLPANTVYFFLLTKFVLD